jgi:hypothetical protein
MNRSALVAGSIACFASAVFLWPAGVRSQLDVRPRAGSLAAAARAEPSVAAIAPAGDAFAPRVAVDDDPAPPRPPAPALPPLHPVRPPAVPEQRTVAATRVTAIATGTSPTAVIESGGVPRIVTAGDSLDGSTIAAIEDDAIRLADGRRLPLEQPGAIR